MSSDSQQGTTSIRVRYAECDPMGVVHHTVYPIWFEIGRTELLRETGLAYRELEEAGVYLAVVDLSVKYRRPARYDDLLVLTTTWKDAGRVKISHAYELHRDGECLVTGTTTLACLDHAGSVRPLPEALMIGNADRD
jgi:acyl-CoA thioester hydrolase